jgi:hypothetical protein
MGLAAVGHHKLVGPLTAGQIMMASDRVGKSWLKVRRAFSAKPGRPMRAPGHTEQTEPAPFKIL